MDFRDSPHEAAFRTEVRDWLQAHLPAGWASRANPLPDDPDERTELRRWWQRELFDAGWAGLAWPVEYGGRGASLVEQVIFNEESARARAPEPINIIGLYMAGPTIIAWASEEQKRRYLPPLLSGEEIWCQGFSEPGSGSDLASVRTRARRDGEHYVVTGQKVWTSYGHLASYCILLTRTSDESSHGGLTYMICPMAQEGVTVRPLVQLTGESEFNEVFFDEALVPVSERLGEEGQGWQVAMTTLLHERATASFGLQAQARVVLAALVDLTKRLDRADDPLIRDALAAVELDLEGLRVLNLRALTKLRKGAPGPEGSMSKLLWERAMQQCGELAMELLGLDAQAPGGPGREFASYWQYLYLRSRANTIEAGTTEILKNIVAERVLGLPRSR